MQPILNLSLNSILDDEFLQTLAKSADLYKIGSNSVLDPEEIRIGLKVVPRAVLSMLISELSPMEINSSKEIKLPFGKNAYMACNKNSADNYTGSVYDNNKLVYDFQNRSIPGLGIILLSTFELYDMEELSGQKFGHSVSINPPEEINAKIQKLIDERMELHSLVGKVVEEKIAQREAIHKIMMNKLSEAIGQRTEPLPKEEPKQVPTSIDVKPKDIVKKETPPKKVSPLKAFLERKKKPKQYHVEMAKSEAVDCPDCGQTIFGSQIYSGCLCMGLDKDRKIWIKKAETGVSLKFSKGWAPENIELLLHMLRKNNGKY